MTDELRSQLKVLAEREADIERRWEPARRQADALMEPYRQEALALDDERETLLAKHSAEIKGNCEGCSSIILEGDKTVACEDGGYLCVECSPSWNDLAKQLRERLEDPLDHAEPWELRDSLKVAEEKIAAGLGEECAAS